MKHTLSFFFLVTVVLSTASLVAQDVPGYTIKGYRLGMSVADVQALQAPFKQKLKSCTKTNANGLARCQAVYSSGREPGTTPKGETIATIGVISMEFRFIDNRLYSFSATFPVERFDEMSHALSAKWGQPNSKTLEILHLPYCEDCRFRYPARRYAWNDGAFSMTLEERGVVNLVDIARVQVDDLTLSAEARQREPGRKPDL